MADSGFGDFRFFQVIHYSFHDSISIRTMSTNFSRQVLLKKLTQMRLLKQSLVRNLKYYTSTAGVPLAIKL